MALLTAWALSRAPAQARKRPSGSRLLWRLVASEPGRYAATSPSKPRNSLAAIPATAQPHRANPSASRSALHSQQLKSKATLFSSLLPSHFGIMRALPYKHALALDFYFEENTSSTKCACALAFNCALRFAGGRRQEDAVSNDLNRPAVGLLGPTPTTYDVGCWSPRLHKRWLTGEMSAVLFYIVTRQRYSCNCKRLAIARGVCDCDATRNGRTVQLVARLTVRFAPIACRGRCPEQVDRHGGGYVTTGSRVGQIWTRWACRV